MKTDKNYYYFFFFFNYTITKDIKIYEIGILKLSFFYLFA